MSRACFIGLFAAIAAAPALAQSPAPSPDVGFLGGPQVAGLCLLSQQAVLANAKVGVAAAARLKELTGESQSEIDADRAPIEADSKTLEAQRASLSSDQFAEKQRALAVRLKALQDKAQLRAREIEATRQKAVARIAEEMRPVLVKVYGARGCGLLMDRTPILGGNMAGDLTAAVVQGLDARITTFAFDRLSLAAAPSSR
jgi:Skp family chaperone for outer membrane proteins